MNLIHKSNTELLHTDRFELKGQTVEWFSSDNLVAYKENLAKGLVPEHYQDVTIQYSFNSMGYRCAELDTYQEKDFIIGMGCSYTQGVGLHQSEIWCEHLAHSMNKQCMNLGQEGSGVDFSLFQTVNYLNSGLPLPSAVFVQNSHDVRRFEVTHTTYQIEQDVGEPGIMLRDTNMSTVHDDYGSTVTHKFQNGKWIDAITHMWNGVGVPVIHWCYDIDCDSEFADNIVWKFPWQHQLAEDWTADVARDNMHNGPVDNRLVAENLHHIWQWMDNNKRLSMVQGETINAKLTPEQEAARKIIAERKRTNIIYN